MPKLWVPQHCIENWVFVEILPGKKDISSHLSSYVSFLTLPSYWLAQLSWFPLNCLPGSLSSL